MHPQFQKHAGLYRIHYALMEMLNLIVLSGDVRKGIALAVQLAKAVRQAALDVCVSGGRVFRCSVLAVGLRCCGAGWGV